MFYLPDGRISFYDIYDLYYELFNEIGLCVKADQYIYDQDTCSGEPLQFKGKFIKASINGQPVYAGRNDILFEPDKNYSLICRLFEYYLNKAKESDDGDLVGGYIAHYVEDNPERDKQAVGVKTERRGIITSEFYYNIYLAYIDALFRIAGYIVDLSAFDIPKEMK